MGGGGEEGEEGVEVKARACAPCGPQASRGRPPEVLEHPTGRAGQPRGRGWG